MLASTLLYGLLAAVSMVDAASPKKQIKYEVVTGVFQQDDAATDPSTFDFLASNFGLINRTYPSDPKSPDGKYATQWQRFNKYVKYLNKEKKTRYSLLFLGRHGEGFHNAAETYFGTPAWNCFWSERDGNGTVTWADAKLTENGIEQARKVMGDQHAGQLVGMGRGLQIGFRPGPGLAIAAHRQVALRAGRGRGEGDSGDAGRH